MLRNKIETDVANVRTLFESYKNDVFRYSIGMFSEIMCIENKFQQGCVILLCIICTDVILHVHCIGICHCASLYINISLITSVHYSKMSKKISTKKSRLIAINSITICNLYWKTSVWHIWYFKMYLISTMFIKISFYSSHCPHSWSYSVSSASFTDSLTNGWS